jgi:hypothetical protein
MKPGNLKRRHGRHIPEIAFSEWNLELGKGVIGQALKELLQEILSVASEDSAYVEFDLLSMIHSRHENPPSKLAVTVELPLGALQHENPQWTLDLYAATLDMVRDIPEWTYWDKPDEVFLAYERAEVIAHGLRELADAIEAEVSRQRGEAAP